jgi:hypothetical protein
MVTTAGALESSSNANVVDLQKDKWTPPVLLHILVLFNDTFSNSHSIALEGRMIMLGSGKKLVCLICGNILANLERHDKTRTAGLLDVICL